MSVTRRERAVLEDMLKRIIKLEEDVFNIQRDVNILQNVVAQLNKKKTIFDLTQKELEAVLGAAIQNIIRKAPVKLHNHESDKQGGPAFAERGANLIE